jgi:hypothetical protein
MLSQEPTLYNSAVQLLINDENYLRELDYFIGDASSPLCLSFIQAISSKARMMQLCGLWDEEGESGICRLLKVWSLRFLKSKFVRGVPYGYGKPEVFWKEDLLSGGLEILINSIGDEAPMGGCLIVASSGSQLIRDFDDYCQIISVNLSAGQLSEGGIDQSDISVMFYGYDFAYYDGSLFNGIVTQLKI